MDKAVTLEAVVHLIGFLLPNRWFNLHAARHVKKAEKEGLITVLGNSAQNV